MDKDCGMLTCIKRPEGHAPVSDLLWLIHLVGICLWFGSATAALVVWPTPKSLRRRPTNSVDIRTLIVLLTRAGHVGAGLTALGGTLLSLYVQPKSDLGEFWLTGMQGLGVVAFIVSIFVLTRLGKRIVQDELTSGDAELTQRYRVWLLVVFWILLISLVLAAFKPIW